jgi:peptidyl-prolyl cis-trans isomerase D
MIVARDRACKGRFSMMDVFRRAAQGWTAKILIGLLVISFAVWGVADVFTGYRADALAKVGSQEISSEEFSQNFRQALQRYSQQLGQSITPERARELGLDVQIRNDMIRRAALDAQAAKMHLMVSNNQVAQEIAGNPAFQDSNGKFNADTFRRLLEQNNLNEPMFVSSERGRLVRTAVTSSVEGQFTVPDALVEAVYKHRNEQRDARYFVVKVQDSEVPAASEADLKAYYEKNPQTFTAPEYRKLAIVTAEPADLAAKQSVSDAELKAGYEKYKSEYFQPERRTILQIPFNTKDEAQKAKARIAAGENFFAIAKERGLSETDATWVERTKAEILDPKLAEAAFKLPEGAISDPVEGQLSVFLLRAVKVTPEHQASFDDVKTDLATKLKLEKAEAEMRSVYDAVEDARAAQTKFEDIASRAGLKFVEMPAIDAQGLDKEGKDVALPHKEDILKQALASDVGVENDAFATDSNGYVWYEVREVTPSQLRPFDTVKDKVKAGWTAQKIRELAIDKAKKLAEKAKTASFDAVAQEAGAEVKTVQGLKRNETNADFNQEAVSALFSVPDNGIVFAPENDGKGAKVMQAKLVMAVPFDPKSAEAQEIRKSLSEAAANDLLGTYLVALQGELGVTVNETLWRQITGAPQQQ